MALPKRKISKARRDMRRANHAKPPRVNLSACPRCGEPKRPHCVCPTCGTYRDMDVLQLEKTAQKA